jgi:hypothetical protein
MLFTALLAMSLTACCVVVSFDRSYNLRQWEKLRIGSEQAFLGEDLPRAEQLIRSALTYAERLGNGDFRVGTTLLQLGDVLMLEGKTGEARTVFEQSLGCMQVSIARSAKERERRQFLNEAGKVLLNLGAICLELDDLPAAEGYFQKAEKVYEELLESVGVERIAEEIGQSLYGLSLVNLKQGRTIESERFYRLAVDSSASAGYSAALARKLRALEPLLRQVPSVPSTVTIQSDERWRNCVLAGREAFSSKNFAEAERQYRLAVEEAGKLGPDNQKLAQAYKDLAASQEWLSKFADAEASYRKALALRDKRSPGGDEESEKILTKLANFAEMRKDYRQSADLLNRQLKIRQQIYGPDSTEVGETLTRLVEVDLARAKNSEAAGEAVKAWAILKESDQTRGKSVVAYESLSQTLFQLGKYSEARQANLKLIAACSAKKKYTLRKLAASYRLAAIAAQEGKQRSASAESLLASASARAALQDPQYMLALIEKLNEDARLLAAHGQMKGAAALAEWSLRLFSDQDKDSSGMAAAKLAVLENLRSLEGSLGHNLKVDRLSAQIADLKRLQNELSGK